MQGPFPRSGQPGQSQGAAGHGLSAFCGRKFVARISLRPQMPSQHQICWPVSKPRGASHFRARARARNSTILPCREPPNPSPVLRNGSSGAVSRVAQLRSMELTVFGHARPRGTANRIAVASLAVSSFDLDIPQRELPRIRNIVIAGGKFVSPMRLRLRAGSPRPDDPRAEAHGPDSGRPVSATLPASCCQLGSVVPVPSRWTSFRGRLDADTHRSRRPSTASTARFLFFYLFRRCILGFRSHVAAVVACGCLLRRWHGDL